MTYTIRPILQTASDENTARLVASVITNRTVEFLRMVQNLTTDADEFDADLL